MMGGLGVLGALCLSSALAAALARGHSGSGRPGGAWHHHPGSQPPPNDTELLQRCADEAGFDAVALDESGTMLFFKGDFVWKGFTGPREPISASWPEVPEGPLDAALRIHRQDHPEVHDSLFLFQGKRVWAYAQGKLRHGYPRLIAEEFPGVPGDLAAAVECHPEECTTETIIFFQGPAVLSYDLKTKDLKRRQWPAVANCSAAVRWLERYYCFQGIRFWRFDPATGDVPPHYPLDARDYFMLCPGRGHGHGARGNATLRAVTDRCSGHPFQAFSSDDSGRIYAFRGGQYFRLDSARDGWHSWPLNHTWKELEGKVDAAFSWEEKLHLIQGSQVTIYRAAPGYPRVEGYPRALQAELGLAGADAAFTCPHAQELYVIQGSQMRRVDLLQSPRAPGPAVPLPHAQVDGALCTSKGVYLFHGADFHHYADVAALSAALAPAPAQSTAAIFFRCPAVAAGSGQQGSPQQRPPRQR
ncbi:hemopexin isoform X1 [Hemicordylus capensis]|uniref:hemopexin isoform X1 n=1 Tax=Hemicordylus capensis TaxID=884348 RepID=UPI002303EF1B|nr:hemopexin isoform X1 [Hemicordylus capensis]